MLAIPNPGVRGVADMLPKNPGTHMLTPPSSARATPAVDAMVAMASAALVRAQRKLLLPGIAASPWGDSVDQNPRGTYRGIPGNSRAGRFRAAISLASWRIGHTGRAPHWTEIPGISPRGFRVIPNGCDLPPGHNRRLIEASDDAHGADLRRVSHGMATTTHRGTARAVLAPMRCEGGERAGPIGGDHPMRSKLLVCGTLLGTALWLAVPSPGSATLLSASALSGAADELRVDTQVARVARAGGARG